MLRIIAYICINSNSKIPVFCAAVAYSKIFSSVFKLRSNNSLDLSFLLALLCNVGTVMKEYEMQLPCESECVSLISHNR